MCYQRTPFRNIYSDIHHKYVRTCKPKFDSLCLTEKEVGQLFYVFDLLDMKKTGIVTSYHLLTYLRCDTHNKFVKRMMYPMRKGLRFDGFVIALWDFCTLKQKHLGTCYNQVLTKKCFEAHEKIFSTQRYNRLLLFQKQPSLFTKFTTRKIPVKFRVSKWKS